MSKDVITSKDLSPAGGLTGVARQERTLREEQLEQSLRRKIHQEIATELKNSDNWVSPNDPGDENDNKKERTRKKKQVKKKE